MIRTIAIFSLVMGLSSLGGPCLAQPGRDAPAGELLLEPPPGNPTEETAAQPKSEAVPDPRFSLEELQQMAGADAVPVPRTALGQGLLPPDPANEVFRDSTASTPNRSWQPQSLHWTASEVWSHPLYFEDVMLERHGHARAPWLQPAVSASRFFGTFVVLPYKMQLDPPRARFSALGHYRPGSPAPLVWQRPRWRRDAAAAQAIVTTGLIFLVP